MGAIQIPAEVFSNAHGMLTDAADEVERIEPFSNEHVERLIRGLAQCQGDAEMWLQDQGVDKTCIATAELLRSMSRAWLVNPLAVYAVAGVDFWREMRKLAYEIWCK